MLKRYFFYIRVLFYINVLNLCYGEQFFAVKKKYRSNFFRKNDNELLVIRYLISGVTVPLHLLVTAIPKVTKTLLVTTKSK
jgi:hypothetical protein